MYSSRKTPGEDPTVNGAYAFAFTKGFQEGYANGSSPYLKASVTVKHFVAYNLEVDVENAGAISRTPLILGDFPSFWAYLFGEQWQIRRTGAAQR